MYLPSFLLEEIEGQEISSQYLQFYSSNQHKIPPLLLFYGPDGVGKESSAERFVRLVFCQKGNSCGVCFSCNSFMNSRHPDYIRFPDEDGKMISIGDKENPEPFTIRWLIQTRIYVEPHIAKFRFILFPNASLIGNEAESALLKTLEEPPPYVRFIFIVNDLNQLKQTIISRSVAIPFNYLNIDLAKKISNLHNRIYYTFQGGSLYQYDLSKDILEEIQQYFNEIELKTTYDFLKLERWVLKTNSKKEISKIGTKNFLLLFASFLLEKINHVIYTEKKEFENDFKIESILKFKQFLTSGIRYNENLIISNLFQELLIHPNKSI